MLAVESCWTKVLYINIWAHDTEAQIVKAIGFMFIRKIKKQTSS